eukprot:scaffold294158_cov10-Tisochrysis_lutea.AAC.1
MPGAASPECALQSASSLSSHLGGGLQLGFRRGSSSQLSGALPTASSGALLTASSSSSQAGVHIGGEVDHAGGVCGMGLSLGDGKSRVDAWTPPTQ